MTGSGWRLAEHELRQWVDGLCRNGRRVIAPVEVDGLRTFRPVASAEEVRLDGGKTRWSPKEYLFPRTETLYSYTLGAAGPELRDPPPAEQEQVLLGVRSCDAAGLVRLDEVFLHGKVEDPCYARRRALTTVVALACHEAGPECFCTAVGGSPMGTEGVDLLVVPFGAYWLLRAESDKGKALVCADWSPATAEHWSIARELTQRVAQQIEREPLVPDAAATLESRFASPVWHELAGGCLGCGVCAYVCPSCSCFDVHHEGNAWEGRELRCWDSCTFALFTRHASGHDPRGSPGARYRQRLLHKFAYPGPERAARSRCVGCGRCIAQCPAGLDVHDVARRVVASAPGGGSDD